MTTRSAALSLFAAAVIFASVSARSLAQTSKPLSLQVGVGSASSSSARDDISSTSFHAGAALELSDTTTLFALPGSEGIDVDYNYASGHGGHYNAYGATYTNRISLLPKIAQPLTDRIVPYVGFGIGVFDAQVSRQTTNTTSAALRPRPAATQTTTSTESGSQTNLGGKLLIGIDTPTGFFVEASYIISGSAEGVRTDSVNLAVGMHL